MAIGISEAVALTSRLVELAKKGATIELREKVMELREAVLNVPEEMLTLREENLQLKRAAIAEHSLIYDKDGLYYRKTESGREGHFANDAMTRMASSRG